MSQLFFIFYFLLFNYILCVNLSIKIRTIKLYDISYLIFHSVNLKLIIIHTNVANLFLTIYLKTKNNFYFILFFYLFNYIFLEK